MLIPNCNVYSYIVQYTLVLISSSFGRSVFQSMLVLSDLAKGGLENGVMINAYDYQNKDKK